MVCIRHFPDQVSMGNTAYDSYLLNNFHAYYHSQGLMKEIFLKIYWLIDLAASGLCCSMPDVSLWCVGLSLVVAHGLSSCGTHELSSRACGILVPSWGIKSVSSALKGRFLTLDYQGSSKEIFKIHLIENLLMKNHGGNHFHNELGCCTSHLYSRLSHAVLLSLLGSFSCM